MSLRVSARGLLHGASLESHKGREAWDAAKAGAVTTGGVERGDEGQPDGASRGYRTVQEGPFVAGDNENEPSETQVQETGQSDIHGGGAAADCGPESGQAKSKSATKRKRRKTSRR